MSYKTYYFDNKNTDIGSYFVDLCNNQTINGTKTFMNIPENLGVTLRKYIHYGCKTGETITVSNETIPTGVNYCDIEICSGGGGGGGGNSVMNSGIMYGGFGGAGGTYYSLTLNVNKFTSYRLNCGSGGSGGNVNNSGIKGNNSYITFYSNNTSYNIDVDGGGGGHSGTISEENYTKNNYQGINKVYGNNGSYYYFDSNVFYKIVNSTFNQPSGGGYGGSRFYNSRTGIYNDSNSSNGGTVFFNNEDSNKIYDPCNVGDSASSLNPFNGGGGGIRDVNEGKGGNGYLGGGGGGGFVNCNGGNGGDGFINLYFY